MARIPKLNWCSSSGNRRGRWRVRYKGKAYYFDGGRGKSDREARKKAEEVWAERKTEIDARLDAAKPHREDYECIIAEWRRVLTWSEEHEDPMTADLAATKIEALVARLAVDKPPPVRERDRFQPLAKTPYRFSDASAMMDMPDDVRHRFAQTIHDKAKWEERLKTVDAVDHDYSLEAQINEYLALQDARVRNGRIGHSRRETFRSHLTTLRDVIGKTHDIRHLSAETVARYFSALSELVSKGAITQTTASDKWAIAKNFVNWLWSREVIADLPRNLNSRDFKFARPPREIKQVPVAELHKILARPTTDRSRLYILLMLNCGFTQVDIADLKKSEISFTEDTITRKRSKTRKKSSVPVVRYRLWPETVRLLAQELDEGADLALLNARGEPLRSESASEDGKFKKNDNIRSAWHRICKRTSLDFSLTAFKKTSATILRSEPRFASIYDYFLGHAPRSVADRHYAAAPQELLDEGIMWLREKLRIEAALQDEAGA